MKRILVLIFLSLALASLAAVGFGVDARSLDFVYEDSLRIDGELEFSYKSLEIIFPIRYGRNEYNTLNYLESGIFVKIHPIDGCGLFAEASFLKVGCFWGLLAPEDPWFLSSEGAVGWHFNLGRFFMEPKLTIRNSLSAESEKEDVLASIPQFSQMRASLFLGAEL